ncbi:MAG TPA: AI-2E family transporter [Chthoniobacterales bacterium]|nr:AI-2E family transporter [Chthoniobacterales bacterium]
MLLTILFFAVILVIAYVARAVLIIFAFSILFAYLIDPVVRFLQCHSLFFKSLRGPHVAEAYLALLIFLALLAHALAPGALLRAGKALQQLPTLSSRLATGEIATEMGNKYGWTDSQTLRAKTFLVQHHSEIQNLLGTTGRFATTVIGALVVIPILAIFFLSGGDNLAQHLISLVATKDNLPVFESLAAELNMMLRHYIRAKIILGGLSFTYASAALLILGFPHAFALGVLAGALEFIPVAGWMISAATITTFGVLTHSHWIWMAALLGLWRMLIDYWIAPRVLGHELEIHPLLAIFTLMVGGAIGGLPGVYLSLPCVAAIRVVWRRFSRSSVTTSSTAAVASDDHVLQASRSAPVLSGVNND